MRVEKNKNYRFEDGQFLYKYIDLHRLIYFLTTRKLFFSPLSYFEDPLEGISERVLLHHTRSADAGNAPGANEQLHEQLYAGYLEKVQRTLIASCWFLGIRESLAMWETYSNRDSVAIRFDPEHLCDVMTRNFRQTESSEYERMVHGKVEYFKLSPFDPGDKKLKNCRHKYTGFIKDISYKHEEEFRFLLIRREENTEQDYFEFCPGPLKDLQFNIISHPSMEPWKYKNIYEILKSVGLEDRLLKSEIPTRKQIFQREM